MEIEYDVPQASNQLAGAPCGFKLTQGAKLIWASTPSGIKCFVNHASTVILTHGNMSDLKKLVVTLPLRVTLSLELLMHLGIGSVFYSKKKKKKNEKGVR